MKRIIAIILALTLVFALFSGCGSVSEAEEKETWIFTDSCGRQVELPVEINSVVPSGSLAQMMLFSVCPDKVQSLATALTKTQKQYIDEKYWDLPVTGQFYGGGATVSYEEIIAAAPDVIIDMGETMDSIAEDMDALQRDTGIPVIFIQTSIDVMAEAYDTLGQITGETEQASQCAEYIRDTLDMAENAVSSIPEDERKTVLYAQGEYGTEVMGEGSVHAQVIEYAGGVNVAVLDSVASKGGNEVSIEQIMLWQPDVIILSPDANYDEIFSDSAWAGVTAVESGNVYEVPTGPYNWLDRPPSVQRILGIRWLGNLLYPDVFDYDMIEETQKFYSLFFHYDLTDQQAQELMANSTYREG
jgi:iron complex transport system substrate-binding protein